MKLMSCACVWALLCLSATSVGAQPALTVVSTAPEGALSSFPDSNEIRIVFSEPMVALGQVPGQVQAPFVRITPAVSGSFRWSGTTTLIFTPERPFPYATTYQVAIDTSATATSGRTLAKPVSFAFTTPTVRLERVRWYRRGNTVNGRLVLLLYFNQPVRSADVGAALSARFEPHEWTAPALLPEQVAAMRAADPAALDRFNPPRRGRACPR